MRKIKIFTIHDRYVDSYEDDYSTVLGAGVSNWEEVSEEDFQYIKNNLHILKNGKNDYRNTLVLVEQSPTPIPDMIVGIKKAIEAQERECQKRLDAEKKRREEAALKRATKKLERDKKALAKLIESNPDLIKELAK